MNEREMLLMAAKAAGIKNPRYQHGENGLLSSIEFDDENDCTVVWQPHLDDGDALRLAVKLRLVVHVWDDGETVSVAKTLPDGEDPPTTDTDAWFAEFAYEGERSIEAATRLAITRAAAQIGKSMP